MKINKYLLTLSFLLILSCIKYDGTIKDKYRKQLNIYKIGEIIVFKSKVDLDSIQITGIDSSSTTQGPSNVPMKGIGLEIRHIPNHIWHDGIKLSKTGHYDSISDQSFINIGKQQRSNNPKDDIYSFHIFYRDFSGSIDYEELVMFKTDTISTNRGQGRDKLNDSSVVKIYWNIEKGLVGYQKKNGLEYKLISE